MTYSLKNWFSLGAAAAVFIGVSQAVIPSNAHAADMLEGEGETLVEFGTGWYLRGDIGGGITEVTAETNLVDGELDLGTPVSFSVGAGYDAGDGFRYEFGLSQITNLSFAGRNSIGCGEEDIGLGPQPVTGDCFFSVNGDLTTSSVTASAFKDFQNIGAFTPYVGVGAGFSYLSSTDMTWFNVCRGESATDCGVAGGIGSNTLASGQYTENSTFALTANAMVGASYDLSDNMKLDLGYKYTYIGSATIAKATDNAYNREDVDLDSLDTHEIRVGLRYAIW